MGISKHIQGIRVIRAIRTIGVKKVMTVIGVIKIGVKKVIRVIGVIKIIRGIRVIRLLG